MKIVIFGLTVSSSWGNGHATLWRGLIKALAKRGHTTVFFEHDVPYYAGWHRDLQEVEGGEIVFYDDWEKVRASAKEQVDSADVALVTSFCPEGVAASELILSSPAPVKAFYDLDTPVTLEWVRTGQPVPYIPERGLGDFDLVLSYTGGRALEELSSRLGARRVLPLYGHVDPGLHHPVQPSDSYRSDLSYLGTYAADRQRALEMMFIEPAKKLSQRRFVIGGAQYPADFPWTPNIYFVRHMPPGQHPAFYCSSRLTLNVTRRAMAEFGYCPSGRLFEAAACGTPVLSDWWEGLDHFLEPGREVLIAGSAEEAIQAIELSDEELGRIGKAAQARVLEQHTSAQRAIDFEEAVASVCAGSEKGEA